MDQTNKIELEDNQEIYSLCPTSTNPASSIRYRKTKTNNSGQENLNATGDILAVGLASDKSHVKNRAISSLHDVDVYTENPVVRSATVKIGDEDETWDHDSVNVVDQEVGLGKVLDHDVELTAPSYGTDKTSGQDHYVEKELHMEPAGSDVNTNVGYSDIYNVATIGKPNNISPEKQSEEPSNYGDAEMYRCPKIEAQDSFYPG